MWPYVNGLAVGERPPLEVREERVGAVVVALDGVRVDVPPEALRVAHLKNPLCPTTRTTRVAPRTHTHVSGSSTISFFITCARAVGGGGGGGGVMGRCWPGGGTKVVGGV